MFPAGWPTSFKGIQLTEAQVMLSCNECGCTACACRVPSLLPMLAIHWAFSLQSVLLSTRAMVWTVWTFNTCKDSSVLDTKMMFVSSWGPGWYLWATRCSSFNTITANVQAASCTTVGEGPPVILLKYCAVFVAESVAFSRAYLTAPLLYPQHSSPSLSFIRFMFCCVL